MSRKPPSDSFTRFTSTAPSSSSANSRFSANPTVSSSQPQPNKQPSSAQPNETPSERVARLRAAHRANTSANRLSPIDNLIARGRTAADYAHRITTYSLLAVTGISTVVAVYGLVSLVSHNRRQKRAWIEREMERLANAQRAFLKGEASAEQLHLLEQERAGEEIAKKYVEDKKRRKEEGTWARLKGTFGTFTSRGDMGVESRTTKERQQEIRDLGELVDAQSQASPQRTLLEEGLVSDQLRPVAVQNGPVAGVGLDEKGRPVPINKVERVRGGRSQSASVSAQAGQTRSQAQAGAPGPLDVWANNAASKASSTSQGWFGWITGSSPSSSSS